MWTVRITGKDLLALSTGQRLEKKIESGLYALKPGTEGRLYITQSKDGAGIVVTWVDAGDEKPSPAWGGEWRFESE